MKKIFGKLLRGIAVIALILSVFTCIAAITGFCFKLFTWYKTGEMNRSAIIEFIPDSWIAKVISTWPGIQEILLRLLNRDIVSSLIEFCLILIFIFFIMHIGAKLCTEKPKEQEKSEIALKRLKKWTSNI